MPLTTLYIHNTAVVDLAPLKGAPLTLLACGHTKVFDLAPLRGMALTHLSIDSTHVSKLVALPGMHLAVLNCDNSRVSDLSPLQGMSLTEITITPKFINMGVDIIRQMQSLNFIGTSLNEKLPPAEFWKKYDAGEFGKPTVAAQPNRPWNTPAFQAWVKDVQALPAEEQPEAVAKKLVELNPEFDGVVTPKFEDGSVKHLGFMTDDVVDISPVRALPGLKLLFCNGNRPRKGKLADLSPLEGINLTTLSFYNTQVSDLTPLRGAKLTILNCGLTQVSDLSVLQGMPLTFLSCTGTIVSDLSPLEDCKSLTTLSIRGTKVTPAQVAALQTALPNCKIEWDDPAKPKTPEPASSGKQ